MGMLILCLFDAAGIPSTSFIHQLRTSHQKLIDHRPSNNPQLIPTYMHPIDPISRNKSIQLKYILAIGANCPNIGPLRIKYKIITSIIKYILAVTELIGPSTEASSNYFLMQLYNLMPFE